jgi:hypothetical protein
MRRLLLLSALALIATEALAQAADEFVLVNGMQNSIVELVISPPDLGIWGDNLLRPPPLEPGEARKVKAWPFDGQCIRDVRAKLAGDVDMVVWKGLKLCNVKKLGLFFDRNSGRPFATYE